MTTSEQTHTHRASGAEPRARRPGRLSLRVVGGAEAAFDLAHGSTVTVGRSPAFADISLRYASMSKRHFSLRVTDTDVEVEDLASKNGVWFADRRIRRMFLNPGDRFFAGDVEIELLEVEHVEVEVADGDRCGLLFGASVVMREFFRRLEKLAASSLDLLVQGETGTGKELTARTIHDLSERRDQPFVVLDCSGLPSTLADAVIFGVSKGAYTGAQHDRAGLFEQAHGGTLFIDEFGELPAVLQMKFLRALDQRQVTRLGEEGRPRNIDVRVVAATNRDLGADVEAGRFRADLMHRVAHSRLRLPPLRERGEDVLLLAESFLEAAATERGERLRMSDEVCAALLAYDWPGNVRELKNAIREAAVLCSEGVVGPGDLSLGRPGWLDKVSSAIQESSLDYESFHLAMDRVYLARVLEECAGSINKASSRLGIGRRRLRERLRAIGLYDGARSRSSEDSGANTSCSTASPSTRASTPSSRQ